LDEWVSWRKLNFGSYSNIPNRFRLTNYTAKAEQYLQEYEVEMGAKHSKNGYTNGTQTAKVPFFTKPMENIATEKPSEEIKFKFENRSETDENDIPDIIHDDLESAEKLCKLSDDLLNLL
jgi:hypothetical protein